MEIVQLDNRMLNEEIVL